MTGGFALDGDGGRLAVHRWRPEWLPRRVVLLAHGYGEHAGRYDHVAARLVADGAAVYAPDHRGHGRSEGERALVTDVEELVDDLRRVARRAAEENPGLPTVLLGHSMGGIIATRYAQRLSPRPSGGGDDALAGLALSGPVIGGNPDLAALLQADPIPEVPIDPSALSRDPAVGEAYAADELIWHGPFKRATLQALVDGVERIAAGASLAGLPALWLHGEQDPLAPLPPTREAVERTFGGAAEARIYPGARHEVLNETNRDEVIEDLAAFVTRVA